MNVFTPDLSLYLSKISYGDLPEELPTDLLYRQELQEVIKKILTLTDEISQLRAESADMKIQYESISREEHLYRSAFERAVTGIMVVSPEGKIINVNQSLEYMFGCPAAEIKDLSLSDFTLPEDHAIDAELLQDVVEGRRNYYQVEKRYARNDGMLFWCLVTVFVVRGESGGTSLIHMLDDISAQKSAELQLQLESTHDSMTGLYNRAHFDSEFGRLQHSMRMPVSIIVIDVDGLKILNDTKGHKAGDRLIVSVAAILKEAFRDDDIVARVGGDEFSVLLAETGADALQVVIERLNKCHSRFNEANPDFPVFFSIGSATATFGDAIPDALKVADEMMYKNKALNKEQVNETMAGIFNR